MAPPIEGRQAHTLLGLGAAGGLLAACCGLGVTAVGGLVVLLGLAVNEQAQQAVDDYLAAVVAEDWERAYELRCAADQQTESLGAFTDRVSGPPRIESYDVGEVVVDSGEGSPFSDVEMTVAVRVTYADGTGESIGMRVEQDPTGQIEVCETGSSS